MHSIGASNIARTSAPLSGTGSAACAGHNRHPMSLAVIHSRALHALIAAEVTVEVHLANGLPSFTMVG